MSKLNTEKNREEWATMNMRLSGSNLTPRQVRDIIAGKIVFEAALGEHWAIEKLCGALSQMDVFLGLKERFSEAILKRLYLGLSESDKAEYRKVTPVLYHLGYNPVLPQEIEEELQALFRQTGLDGRPGTGKRAAAVDEAVFIHNELMRIYPFNGWNEELARAAMEYTLVYYGEAFCPVTLSEQEYNDSLIAYLRGRDGKALGMNLKMNLLMAEGR